MSNISAKPGRFDNLSGVDTPRCIALKEHDFSAEDNKNLLSIQLLKSLPKLRRKF